MKQIWIVFTLVLGIWTTTAQPGFSGESGDTAFNKLADEYISGYLRWRPQTGTTLGLHQYDGRVTDFSKASLDIELSRLKSFDWRLSQLKETSLSPAARYD